MKEWEKHGGREKTCYRSVWCSCKGVNATFTTTSPKQSALSMSRRPLVPRPTTPSKQKTYIKNKHTGRVLVRVRASTGPAHRSVPTPSIPLGLRQNQEHAHEFIPSAPLYRRAPWSPRRSCCRRRAPETSAASARTPWTRQARRPNRWCSRRGGPPWAAPRPFQAHPSLPSSIRPTQHRPYTGPF